MPPACGAAIRQGSMIHIWDELYRKQVEQNFHEAFFTHTSTSPNYQVSAHESECLLPLSVCLILSTRIRIDFGVPRRGPRADAARRLPLHRRHDFCCHGMWMLLLDTDMAGELSRELY